MYYTSIILYYTIIIFRPQIETEDLPPVEIDPLVLTQLQARLQCKLRLLSMELPESVTESRLLSEFHYATQCGSSEKVRQAILLQQVINELDKEDKLVYHGIVYSYVS